MALTLDKATRKEAPSARSQRSRAAPAKPAEPQITWAAPNLTFKEESTTLAGVNEDAMTALLAASGASSKRMLMIQKVLSEFNGIAEFGEQAVKQLARRFLNF